MLGREEQVGLAWSVVLGFLRLSTRGGVLPKPLVPAQALNLVEEWLNQPLFVLVHPGAQHWSIFRALLEGSGTAGNLTTDAHLASLAIEYDATLCSSSDSDFAKFSALKVLDPLESE